MDKVLVTVASGFDFSSLWVLLAAILCVGIFICFCALFRSRLSFLEKIIGFCKGLWQGFVSCVKMDKGWLFMLQTAFVWVSYWLMSYSVLHAVQGMDTAAIPEAMASCVENLSGLGPVDALFLMLAGSLSSLVPVPGGFGAFHYIVAMALSSVYGIPFGIGIVFATLSHESQTLTMIVCGTASCIDETLQGRKAC